MALVNINKLAENAEQHKAAAFLQLSMSNEHSNASAGQQALYPSPPAFYKLYREDADGTAERPFPPAPPAAVTGDFQMFGEIHTVRYASGAAERRKVASTNIRFRRLILAILLCKACHCSPLHQPAAHVRAGQHFYDSCIDWLLIAEGYLCCISAVESFGCICADIKQELLKMNEELLFSFHELLSILISQPSRWPQQIADISTLLRQMHHLLNMLRPHQVSHRMLRLPAPLHTVCCLLSLICYAQLASNAILSHRPEQH